VDITLVLAALPAASLLIGAAALAIFVRQGRPIFFSQDRVGHKGKIFRIKKLRTMSTEVSGSAATIVGDQRITPLGQVLRQYRIDELPQLINIIKGEMSLIGPRPEQPHLVQEYRNHIPGFETRHFVRPGLTGLAQVTCGYASNLDETRTKVVYDLQYVQRASIWLDLKIAAKTVKTVLRRDGAR